MTCYGRVEAASADTSESFFFFKLGHCFETPTCRIWRVQYSLKSSVPNNLRKHADLGNFGLNKWQLGILHRSKNYSVNICSKMPVLKEIIPETLQFTSVPKSWRQLHPSYSFSHFSFHPVKKHHEYFPTCTYSTAPPLAVSLAINALIYYLQLIQSLFTNNLSTSSKSGSKGIPPKYPPTLRGLLLLLFTLFFLAISFYIFLHKISVLQFCPADINVRATMVGAAALTQQGEAEESQLALPAGEVASRKANSSPPSTCGEVTERLEQGCAQRCVLGWWKTIGINWNKRSSDWMQGETSLTRTVKQVAQSVCVNKDIHRGFENL